MSYEVKNEESPSLQIKHVAVQQEDVTDESIREAIQQAIADKEFISTLKDGLLSTGTVTLVYQRDSRGST